MDNKYEPPYTITDKILNLVVAITAMLGEASFIDSMKSNPKLRRENRLRTIHASLAIENNTLSLDQVTDIIDGKRVMGNIDEITEVKNAYNAYENLLELDPYSIDDMLKAHKLLMEGLAKEAGRNRSGGVGVFDGSSVIHVAPPAKQVPNLMKNLFDWIKTNDVHPLIKSCVFHYEFEFIHPFSDGNGRMGRMWQTLLLYNWNKIFGWLPIETIIKENQAEYYRVLGESDDRADSGQFIEFMLNVILNSLEEVLKTIQVTVQVKAQLGSNTTHFFYPPNQTNV